MTLSSRRKWVRWKYNDTIEKLILGFWRDGFTMKTMNWSCTGFEFSFEYPHGGKQLHLFSNSREFGISLASLIIFLLN